jgi:hypothetical protein
VADRAGRDTEGVAQMTGHRSVRHFTRVTHGSMIHLTGAIRTRSPMEETSSPTSSRVSGPLLSSWR